MVKSSNYKESSCKDKEMYWKVIKTKSGINSPFNDWYDDTI